MEVVIEKKKYDRYQRRLLREIIKAIRKDLSESNVTPALICELTENIAFSVSAIVDGSHVMQVDGKTLAPILTFRHPGDPDALVSCGSASFMHEYAIGMAEELTGPDLLKSLLETGWIPLEEFMRSDKKKRKKNAKRRRTA